MSRSCNEPISTRCFDFFSPMRATCHTRLILRHLMITYLVQSTLTSKCNILLGLRPTSGMVAYIPYISKFTTHWPTYPRLCNLCR